MPGDARSLRLTEADYRHILIAALEASTKPGYLRIVTQISGVLDFRPVLDRAALSLLTGRVV
jgi:hypothetical protein